MILYTLSATAVVLSLIALASLAEWVGERQGVSLKVRCDDE